MIVIPETVQRRTTKRAVVTLPKELATVRCLCPALDCPGINVTGLGIEHQSLQSDVLAIGAQFIERMAIRGIEHIGTNLWLHGPFVSQEFGSHLVDVESSKWRDAQRLDKRYAGFGSPGDEHPEEILPFVYDRLTTSPFCDYFLYGWFTAPEKQVRTMTSWANDRSGVERIPILEGIDR